MYRSMFPHDIFAEMDRIQRALSTAFEGGASIRGLERGTFPAINQVTSADAMDIYLFAPGLDPQQVEVSAEAGVLTVAGQRTQDVPQQEERVSVHVNERFAGRFRKVIPLGDDADLDQISADYHDGILHVQVKRSAARQPRRISIQ